MIYTVDNSINDVLKASPYRNKSEIGKGIFKQNTVNVNLNSGISLVKTLVVDNAKTVLTAIALSKIVYNIM